MTNHKKSHWLRFTLIVLIVCGIVGTALAAFQFNKEAGTPYASATIQFSFDGAANGKAPNGYPFDVSGFMTDDVLNTALEASGLADTYSAEQLRGSLTVIGQYPENIAEQMTKYVSLLDMDADMQAAITDYHATEYAAKLYNGFDKTISSEQLSELLNQIMTAYRNYFEKSYAVSIDVSDSIANLIEYDYAQQLEAISENVSQQKRYAEEMADMAPEFRMNQKGFGAVVVRFQNLDSEINRLTATITLNAISKDRDRLQKRYEMELRSQKMELESLTEELKQIEEQVNAYVKDGIIYVSANGTLSEVGKDENDTYDKLVAIRKKVTDQIADVNAKIARYQILLDDMTGNVAVSEEKTKDEDHESAATIEELSEEEFTQLRTTVEKRIELLNTKKNAVVQEFSDMLDAYTAQEINEKTLALTKVNYYAPSLISGEFIVKVLKTAGPICAVGFMVCLILLIVSRWREEKLQKK